jgi:hypothetical protein
MPLVILISIRVPGGCSDAVLKPREMPRRRLVRVQLRRSWSLVLPTSALFSVSNTFQFAPASTRRYLSAAATARAAPTPSAHATGAGSSWIAQSVSPPPPAILTPKACRGVPFVEPCSNQGALPLNRDDLEGICLDSGECVCESGFRLENCSRGGGGVDSPC